MFTTKDVFGVLVLPKCKFLAGNFGSSTAAKEEEERKRIENENVKKLSKELSLGWSHTSEWKKKQRLLELAKQQEAQEKIKEEISKEEMELEIKRKQDIINETQKLLNFDTGRYKEIHQGMMIAEIFQENDKAFEIKRERDEALTIANKKEDEHYLAKIKAELIKDQEKLLKQKQFEKAWQEKRKIQIEDKKEGKYYPSPHYKHTLNVNYESPCPYLFGKV